MYRYGAILMDRRAGFSLVEVMISLIILGLIGGMGLAVLGRYQEGERLRKTKDHQERLLSLLAAQVITTGALPAPAQASVQGAERGYAATTLSGGTFGIGLVPFKTLGVPEALARDGYGRFFTYGVQGALTSLGRGPQLRPSLDVYLSVRTPILQVLDGEARSLTRPQEVIAVVLVSHGKVGYGAFDNRGQRLVASVTKGRHEGINADETAAFIDRPLSDLRDDYHDDVVAWATRDTLLALHGKAPHLLEVRR